MKIPFTRIGMKNLEVFKIFPLKELLKTAYKKKSY